MIVYTSPEQFDREMESFDDHWIPVAMADEVAEPDSFVVRRVGRREVVIQNFGGSLKAFLNVCTHRFNRLQAEPCGTRKLICGYHGWEFGADGLPCRIPKRPRFENLSPERHRLIGYAVDTCGKLIFVRRRAAGLPLGEWLGIARPFIEMLTSACGERIAAKTTVIRANWKILVENTLEAYHVGHVHAGSFHRIGPSAGHFYCMTTPHTAWHADVSEKALKTLHAVSDAYASRPRRTDQYIHQLVWPTCTIATLFGLTYGVQFFTPLDASTTQFTSVTYATDGVVADHERRRYVNETAARFNEQVFAEDAAVCEAVQRGCEDAVDSILGCLSEEEARVAAFQKATALAADGRL